MMKKHAFLLSCLLLSCTVHIHAQEEETPTSFNQLSFEPFTGTITGSKVRMRTQPNVEGYVVRETTGGELFAVIGEESDYYAVVPSKNTKGYIFRTFVLDGRIEGERVNVRLYPDIEAPSIARLNTGDSVSAVVSDYNNKWLEINLPDTCHFYIAKEYVDNIGSADLITKLEKRQSEASHHLSACFLYTQAEIQKPFEQIDYDLIHEKFESVMTSYHDLPAVMEQAKEASALIQEIYVQKKIAFLESKAGKKHVPFEIPEEHLEKLTHLGIDLQPQSFEVHIEEIASAASNTMGLAATISDALITDKMLSWQPLEESLFHLWTVANGEKNIEEFYHEEQTAATYLTGIIEPYNRPVKNCPGDYLLRNDTIPVAFLYSTKINLQQLIGKKVTLIASPRPNHNFAFPAYFVLDIE